MYVSMPALHAFTGGCVPIPILHARICACILTSHVCMYVNMHAHAQTPTLCGCTETLWTHDMDQRMHTHTRTPRYLGSNRILVLILVHFTAECPLASLIPGIQTRTYHGENSRDGAGSQATCVDTRMPACVCTMTGRIFRSRL
jgi:hypothetical protein